ncbi:hypothetical protein Mcate_02676 [Meiothermus taiwanensis]|uniref:Uncharacterized protein n=1 Tax=Meiothermus taiwanensis TaxID=172827 RepID=A0A399DQB0_9DEIN|nr:hypothetical protein Mcate_02676 [Meiothermus taiwanensis]
MGLALVGQVEHQVGLLGDLQGPLHPAFLDYVVGFPNPGGVHRHDGHPGDLQGGLEVVAGGAGDGGHDGPLVAQQGIEQAGLARIGRTHQGDAGPFLGDAPGGGGGKQAVDLLQYGLEAGLDLGGFDPFLGVVQPGLDMRQQVEKLL